VGGEAGKPPIKNFFLLHAVKIVYIGESLEIGIATNDTYLKSMELF
jgi:hypothetical protein